VCVGPELVTEVEDDADADEFEVDVDEVDEDSVDEQNDGVDDEKKDGQQKRYLFRGLIYSITCQHIQGSHKPGKPGIVSEFRKPGKVREFEIWSGNFFMTCHMVCGLLSDELIFACYV